MMEIAGDWENSGQLAKEQMNTKWSSLMMGLFWVILAHFQLVLLNLECNLLAWIKDKTLVYLILLISLNRSRDAKDQQSEEPMVKFM